MMNLENNLYKRAVMAVMAYINPQEIISVEELKKHIDYVCNAPTFKEINKKKLLKYLEMDMNISYSGEGILDINEKNDNHVKWLFENGAPIDKNRRIDWSFWRHYEQHLYGHLPINAIENIDGLTNKILMRLEDPKRQGGWSRKGLVVGDVQSGKTGNYTGLICKAADAGYKLIIVFAGLHKSLRAQTQQRLDESFIGFNTDKDDKKYEESFRIGVGLYKKHPPIIYLTTSNDNGDFSKLIAQGTGVPFGNNPIVLVVKKNKSIIDNLVLWSKRMGTMRGETQVKDFPLLVIDDECDNASINTSKYRLKSSELPKDEYGNPIEEYDPTAINRGIRKILKLFHQNAYVGYTATPFANILIHRQSFHKEYGEDLFPKHFIINLPTPSNYVGPSKFFGLDEDNELGIESVDPFPLYREVHDATAFIPRKHKSDFTITERLPDSLKKALYSFILSCAARIARGMESEHNTMLIHVTRYTNVQAQIAALVQEEIRKLDRRIRLGEGSNQETLDELKSIWENDYLKKTSSQMSQHGEINPWSIIEPNIKRALEKLQDVKLINGAAGDILEYKNYREVGINVIAVGGDKLSRGLTLEGLAVSYFLRVSSLYDTLMQMGRWFGYRPGYLDLCRLYTTSDLHKWYRHIAFATAELKKEFDYMVDNNEEPESYGLKVRSHPDALSVTSLGKMRSGERMLVTYDGYMVQTLVCFSEQSILKNNFTAIETLLNKKKCQEVTGNKKLRIGYKYENIPSASIIDFLAEYKVPKDNLTFKSINLSNYIKTKNNQGELTDWTVIVLSPKKGYQQSQKLNEMEITCTERNSNVIVGQGIVTNTKAILSRSHEKLDLRPNEVKKLTRDTPKEIRNVRSSKRGLLLVYMLKGTLNNGEEYGVGKYPVTGIVLSFPKSKNSTEVEYIVDALYAENNN